MKNYIPNLIKMYSYFIQEKFIPKSTFQISILSEIYFILGKFALKLTGK